MKRENDLLLDMTLRTQAAPSAGIALGVHGVGHYRIPAGRREDTPVRRFAEVFWGVAGHGSLRFQGEEHILHPEETAVYLPGTEHHLMALAPQWEYYWCSVDGPIAQKVVSSLNLNPGIIPTGPAPAHLFEAIKAAMTDQSFAGEREASALAYRLLCMIIKKGQAPPVNPVAKQALSVIHEQWANADFGIDTLASAVRTHRSMLSREFKTSQGMAPSRYLTRLRMKNALRMLENTSLSIAEIATQCGYSDPNYFSRIFRHAHGQSPLQFRKNQGFCVKN